MRIVELSEKDFVNFTSGSPLKNYYQTPNYAKVMSDKGYTYDYIGYWNNSNNLVGASLILKKKIGTFAKFVYAPKGILVDYYDTELLKMFIKDLCSYYKKRGFSFLKINPEVIIGEVSKDNNYKVTYNQNVEIIDVLKNAGFKRRRELYPHDFLSPRINTFIDLKNFELSSEVERLLGTGEDNGLSIEIVSNNDLDILYEFTKDSTSESASFYKSILNHFNNDMSQVLLVKVNYEQYLINARERYENELENNNYYNELIQHDGSDEVVLGKMQSDKDLLRYKDEVVVATAGLKQNKFKYIGGALIVKYENRVSIALEGFENDDILPKYFLYNYIINTYKDSFEFLDLNGLASSFDSNSKYEDFNKPKLDFNPLIYEFIGEFDIVLNELLFKKIQSQCLLSKEFLPSHKFE